MVNVVYSEVSRRPETRGDICMKPNIPQLPLHVREA